MFEEGSIYFFHAMSSSRTSYAAGMKRMEVGARGMRADWQMGVKEARVRGRE